MASWEHDFDLTYTKLILERLAHAPRADVKPVIARHRSEHGSGVGRLRWVVERTFAWLGRYRRLAKDYERSPRVSEAWIRLAMIRLMLRRLAAA